MKIWYLYNNKTVFLLMKKFFHILIVLARMALLMSNIYDFDKDKIRGHPKKCL